MFVIHLILINLDCEGQELFFGIPLVNRPLFLLAALMVVLGVQLLALGLIGELMIFIHARELKEYTIKEIVN